MRWCVSLKLQEMFENSNCKYNALLGSFHQYITGSDFIRICNSLVNRQINKTENKVLSKAALSVLHLKFKEQANEIVSNQSVLVTDREIVLDTTSPAMKSKIRYIGGHCLFHAKKKIQKYLKGTLSNTGQREKVWYLKVKL